MIKTIEAQNIEEFDKLVNEFDEKYLVFATQTHIVDLENMQTKYYAVIFHRGLRK